MLPVAKALGIDQSGTNTPSARYLLVSHTDTVMFEADLLMAGKLKGQMAPVTPNGSLMLVVSISFATSTLSPFSNDGIAQAASTTCSPRKTSPLASAWVLPCSSEMLAAISDWYCRIRAWYLPNESVYCDILVRIMAVGLTLTRYLVWRTDWYCAMT